MPEQRDVSADHFLSTQAAQPADRRLAAATVVVSIAAFAAAAPFARQPLAPVPAFLPLYQSALVVSELVTAVMLLGQFRILRTRALLAIAAGYLFSALMAVAHGLSFPDLFHFAPALGVGPQTTAWLYFLWHAGFPLFVIAYALLKDAPPVRAGPAAPAATLAGVGAAAALLFLLTTGEHGLLPVIMNRNADAPAKVWVATATWVLSLVALAVVWRRRPHSLLDLWLMVVMCAWVFDVALAAVLNHARYDVGWYAGRIYGLAAATFVLVVLALDNSKLYGMLARAHAGHVKRLQILNEIDRAVAAGEPPGAVAGAVVAPLRELLRVPRAIVNLFDLEAGVVEWLAASGRRQTRVGPGVRYSLSLMGDVEALKRGEPQVIDTHALPPGPDRDALLASGIERYMAVPMIAGGQLIGAVSFGGAPGPFAEDQVRVAREVATQLAIAVNQARLYERVQKHSEELEARVRERTAELELANRELDAFSSSVSHDLRAPLRAMDGYARMLEEDNAAQLDAEGRQRLQVIRDGSRQMGRLIDDLLAFSRLGRQALNKAPVDMDALVADSLAGLGDLGHARISITPLPPAPADRALLKQVWANLLSNAVKYSAKREAPEIAVSGSRDGGEIVYAVRDNGAGFDMRYANRLFVVFQRLHHPSDFPGTGVGLANVQRIVVRHGGRVWAEGEPGRGATFYFSLPA